MKKHVLLFTLGLFLFLSARGQTTVTITAGGLKDALAAQPNVADLTINGTMNAYDFIFIPRGIEKLNLSGVTQIARYEDTDFELGTGAVYPAGEIPADGLYQRNQLTSITLPTNGAVTSIGRQAFSGCKSLTSISLPQSLTAIAEYAFHSTGIKSITLPNSVVTLGGGIFLQSQLEQITLPSGLTEIPEAMFMVAKLTSITIPATVKTIGSKAFSGNTGLTEIKLPDGLEWLGGMRTFQETGISTLEIPAQTKIIDGVLYETFRYAENLRSVTIPSNVTIIDQGVFSFTAITSIVIPEGVVTIGNFPFVGSRLTSIEIPNSVTSIGNYAFNELPLTSVTLGTGVTTLGEAAFMSTQLTSLALPAGLVDIGESAFENITTLKSLTVNNPEPVIFTEQTNIFNGIDKANTILYVPQGAVADYREFDLWKDFANIREIGSGANEQTLTGFNDLVATVGATLALNAQASSGLTVTYTIADASIATLSGNTLTVLKEGQTTIKAVQAGDGGYLPVEKTITLTVVNYNWLEEPAITVEGDMAKVVGPRADTFTKFFVNGEETGGSSVNIAGATGAIVLRATSTDGSVIKLTISR